jgi:hypothetical protein
MAILNGRLKIHCSFEGLKTVLYTDKCALTTYKKKHFER